MFLLLRLLCLCFVCGFWFTTHAQRSYKPSSVLANGAWYKISVTSDGVYKMDVPFLASLGISGAIPSDQIRIFGNNNGMLPEANAAPRVDDLEELAIRVEDGGDGQLNGSDYVLFYASGPDQWMKDSVNKRFNHKKNLYTDKAFYFINIGGVGKRISTQTQGPAASIIATSFNERYFHELDSINFLSSGKEWYGEEFSSLPGHRLTQNFTLPLADVIPGQATFITSAAARSVNTASRFTATINGQFAQQFSIPPIGTGQFDLFVQQAQKEDLIVINQSSLALNYTYVPGSANSQGWLNWFKLFCRRGLVLGAGKQLPFRDWTTVGNAAVQFNISGADAATQVWDVTNPVQPVKMASTLSGTQLSFSNEAMRLREYVAFSTFFLLPKAEGRVANQNLHATINADYLIVTPPQFIAQAQRLAQFHQQRDHLVAVIATTNQIFNEFAGGVSDPTAIRDFAKMYFDKYASTWNVKGKYLLLFGKASFDYKDRIGNNTNWVPGYESPSSVDPLSTYTSDDVFGFLEDAEDINSGVVINTLDIGIGRIPAKTVDEAKAFVDKVMDYHSAAAFGPWRTNLNFIADDEDQNLHLQDAEAITATAATAPVFNQQKIYLDAFQQESGSAGGRYPGANAAINNDIYTGTLIWNYSGHGGSQRLAEEDVLDQDIVNNFTNQYRLPLFITATCDFAPYDNPTANSLGEHLITRPKTGAIALMTTTRVVFANSNRIINNNYLKVALQPDAGGRYKSLGEAVQASKNLTYTSSGDITNNRKFALLGDPAMTLAFPTLKVAATVVNGKNISAQTDTLSATQFVVMDGEVQDGTSQLQTSFNGTVYLSLFDKVRSITTLGNDPTSYPVSFPDQSKVLFRGKATATAGKFNFKFRLPKDINFQYGAGKISLYAQDGTKDGAGFSTNIIIGGIAQGGVADNVGPEIKAYLNDDRFVNGSITNAAPVLLLKLSDSSGINTGSSGIDHDIVATLDGDNNRYFVLNNFYESDINDYQKGTVHFQLPALSPGPHSLKIKAWDVVNNSNEYLLNFSVINNEELRLDHVLNYPNPFTTKTAFWFEHNYPGIDLTSKVEIFTVGGKLIKTIVQTINTAGNRSMELDWDGRDEWGNKIGRGVYIYRLYIKAANGKTASKWERLVIL